jgi:Zn-finger domain-containing protein
MPANISKTQFIKRAQEGRLSIHRPHRALEKKDRARHRERERVDDDDDDIKRVLKKKRISNYRSPSLYRYFQFLLGLLFFICETLNVILKRAHTHTRRELAAAA